MFPRCSHCGGLLFKDTDGYENYLTCCACARQYNFDKTARVMTLAELEDRYGIKLTDYHKSANIEIE